MFARHLRKAGKAAARGMTLIEIMVVLVILGLIAGAIGYNVFQSLKDAQVKTAKLDLQALSNSVDLYHVDTGRGRRHHRPRRRQRRRFGSGEVAIGMRGRRASGMTLVEIGVVLAVAGLMLAVAIPALSSVTRAQLRQRTGQLAGGSR